MFKLLLVSDNTYYLVIYLLDTLVKLNTMLVGHIEYHILYFVHKIVDHMLLLEFNNVLDLKN